MSIEADHYTSVVGVDAHAANHTHALIESPSGKLIDQKTFPTTPRRVGPSDRLDRSENCARCRARTRLGRGHRLLWCGHGRAFVRGRLPGRLSPDSVHETVAWEGQDRHSRPDRSGPLDPDHGYRTAP